MSAIQLLHKVPKESGHRSRSSLVKWASGLIRSQVTFNITRAIEDWLDQSGITEFTWTKYQHPHYVLAVTRHVRGQAMALFFDYEADRCLGLFAYLPFLYEDSRHHEVLRLINAANLELRYGHFELLSSEPRLRFRITIDVQSLMLNRAYIDHMLGCFEYACNLCLSDLMTVSWKPSAFGSS